MISATPKEENEVNDKPRESWLGLPPAVSTSTLQKEVVCGKG
jgi:hypothetical protein